MVISNQEEEPISPWEKGWAAEKWSSSPLANGKLETLAEHMEKGPAYHHYTILLHLQTTKILGELDETYLPEDLKGNLKWSLALLICLENAVVLGSGKIPSHTLSYVPHHLNHPFLSHLCVL